jgi:hypothetical protein
VHREQRGAGVLADRDGVAGMVFVAVGQRHVGHTLDRVVQRDARIRKGLIEAEERIDQDARCARVDAEAEWPNHVIFIVSLTGIPK